MPQYDEHMESMRELSEKHATYAVENLRAFNAGGPAGSEMTVTRDQLLLDAQAQALLSILYQMDVVVGEIRSLNESIRALRDASR